MFGRPSFERRLETWSLPGSCDMGPWPARRSDQPLGIENQGDASGAEKGGPEDAWNAAQQAAQSLDHARSPADQFIDHQTVAALIELDDEQRLSV